MAAPKKKAPAKKAPAAPAPERDEDAQAKANALQDLYQVMGIEDGIDCDKASEDELDAELKEVVKELDPKDVLKPETTTTLTALGLIKAPAAKKATAPAKSAPAKSAPAKSAPAKAKKAKASVEKDEFGYRIGSKKNLFAMAIKKTPMTMDEVKDLPWNENKATYNGTWAELKRSGRGVKRPDGKLSIK